MISALVPLLLEAALRALLAAVAVWAGLRLLRVGNVAGAESRMGSGAGGGSRHAAGAALAGSSASAAPRLPALAWTSCPRSEAHLRAFLRRCLPMPAEPATAALQPRRAATPAHRRSVPPRNTRPIIPRRSISQLGLRYSCRRRTACLTPRLRPTPADSPRLRPSTAHQANPLPFVLAALAWLLYLGVFAALLLRLLVGLASALRLWMTRRAGRAPARVRRRGRPPPAFQPPRRLPRQHRLRHRSARRLRWLGRGEAARRSGPRALAHSPGRLLSATARRPLCLALLVQPPRMVAQTQTL